MENLKERAAKRHIIELPKQTADKIAAGEVIERPISIVKELIENSLDAGATSIVTEIKNGGKSYIRVTDDGCGIRSDEIELAFKRHATSKLREAKDLDAIDTLGFRGEALASIAAVSRTELITRTAQDDAGTIINVEGGVTANVSSTGCPVGTTIIVKDLFFNTPARMKFLKKDNTESALIIDFISKIALAYPHVRIRLINNGNTLFATPGKGDVLSAIATVYDSHIAKKLIHFEKSGEKGLHLDAYISAPDETKASRKSQIFFVNGRYIQSKLLEKAISDGYRERLFEGRFPVAFLFLEVESEFVDVNIHPNKREVRFDDDELVRNFVTGAIKEALKGPDALPEIRFHAGAESGSHIEKNAWENSASQTGRSPASQTKIAGRGAAENGHFLRGKTKQVDIHEILKAKRTEEEQAAYKAEASIRSNDASGAPNGKARTGGASELDELARTGGLTSTVLDESSGAGNAARVASMRPDGTEGAARATGADGLASVAHTCEKPMSVFAPKVEPAEYVPFDVASIRPIGTLFATYILGCDDDSFYMIDQHAAHERIFYEKLTREFYGQQHASQLINIPINIEVTPAVKNAEDDWYDFLYRVGFVIEEFGPRSFIVKEIPAYMDLAEAEAFINDFFDELGEPGSFRDTKRAQKIITRSCKSAIKANDRLDTAEIKALIADLAKAKNPFSCPHGRPTIIRMKRSQVEALFKR